MASITLRSVKGTPLTNAEVDANFSDINTEVGTKQDALVSGTNIKTINGSSLLGSGNLTISGGSSTLTISSKSANYTVVAGDLGTIISFTGSISDTCSLTSAATLGAGFNCWVWNDLTIGILTIDPAGSETIAGALTLAIGRGQGVHIVSDGTNWKVNDWRWPSGFAFDNDNISSSIAKATGSGSIAIGYAASATGGYSTAIGANSAVQGSRAGTGIGAMALGGSYASGTDSFAAAVANNTSTYGATGGNSIAVGYLSKGSALCATGVGYTATATGQGSLALGYTPTASGNSSIALSGVAINSYAIAIGSGYNGAGSTASGNGSIALSGSTASGDGSVAIGRAATTQSIYGKFSFASSGLVAAIGDSQCGLIVLRKATTNATPAVLVSNDSANAAGSTNQIILPNNSAFAFSILLVGRQQAAGGTASAAWKIEGLIRREGTAASTTLVNSATTVLDNTPGWTVAVSADTTNGGLAVTVTGAAATNIRWVATAQTTEVTYA